MKVKELIRILQQLKCDEKQVVIDWQESINKYVQNRHDDYLEVTFGLSFIPVNVLIDQYSSRTGDVLIQVKLEGGKIE